MPKPYF